MLLKNRWIKSISQIDFFPTFYKSSKNLVSRKKSFSISLNQYFLHKFFLFFGLSKSVIRHSKSFEEVRFIRGEK